MRQPIDHTYRGSVALRFLGLIIAATIPALLLFPADLRPAILRVALAAGLAIAFLHLVGRLIGAARDGAASDFEQALVPPTAPVRVDSTLTQLRDEIRYSRTSRRYFDKVLWPRLLALASRRGIAPEDLPKPAGWPRHRGPSLKSMSDLVDRLETRK
ncbi:MAG: hypothetical protein EXQ95_15125 [Alphaproteobacteria bacterium]|nr:hypothetical protein [Alphaproteobacteria bacterium]